ncbi:MAG TPA: FAD-binding oxidoreductase [Methanothrix sp.]|nr:FAD-binding oxidoreductase [Methanothrix sp.]
MRVDVMTNVPFETQIIVAVDVTPSVRAIRFIQPRGFEYAAGQFVILSLDSEKGAVNKPLSLSSSPTEQHLEVAKRLTGHEFSNAFLSLKKDDKIRFTGPYGNFTFKGEHRKVAMLSGGIGITPLLSMIRYCTDMDIDTEIVLFYSNRQEDDIPFRDELDRLMARNRRLTVVHTLTRPGTAWKGRTGRINAQMIKDNISNPGEWVYYSSGPAKMVEAMISLLKEMNIDARQIKKEYFPGYD